LRLAIGNYTATTAAGVGLAAMDQSIAAGKSGLRPNDLKGCDLDTWIGRVEMPQSHSLPPHLQYLQSRDNLLAWLGLQQDGFLEGLAQLTKQVGTDRVGVIMGTSTSSIGRTEEAYTKLLPSGVISKKYWQPEVLSLHAPGAFVSAATGLLGPSMTISTACSSSAKVFASAARWISYGLVDAVVVGGVDGLCMSILYGFNSLELLSSSVCRPFDRRRNGINIGEGCGFAILARAELLPDAEFAMLGYGESSDAYHMSHPHPEGEGAVAAIDQALLRAQISAEEIEYVNLHGTASQANDRIEAQALAQRFSSHTLASSTKAWTGHALGAAGVIEAVITLQALRNGLIPGTLNCEEQDPEAAFEVITKNVHRSVDIAMMNSFGFGGNNAALILGKMDG